MLVQLRKQEQVANQRALVARRKNEQLQLEVAFLRMMNEFSLMPSACTLAQIQA